MMDQPVSPMFSMRFNLQLMPRFSFAKPGINGALTAAQKGTDATDTLEAFTADIIKSGGGRSTPELVDVLVHKSTEVGQATS